MLVVLVIIVYVIIGYIEIAHLYNKKQKKELVLYSITLIFAFTLSVLLCLGVKIPSPANPIEKIVMTILGGR